MFLDQIAEITFFMLPSTIIPPGYGAILYYTAPPSGEWEILGSVFLDKPSGMFRTGWPERSDMNIAGIQLGVELSPLETIQNLELTRSGFDDRLDYAKKVARDLYNYMSSFGQPSQQNMMLVPTNVFDKWLARFEGKFRQDPNFLLKLKQGD